MSHPRRFSSWPLLFAPVAAGLLAALLVSLPSAAQPPPPILPDSEVSTPEHPATPPAPPGSLAPTEVRAEPSKEKDDPSGGSAVVTWKAPTALPQPGQELKGYRVYRAADQGAFEGLLEAITKPEQISQEGQEPRLSAPVSDLWTWHRYRFKVAALYGPQDPEEKVKAAGPRPWYMKGQVKPERSKDWGEPLLVDEVLSEDASGVVHTHAKWYRIDRTNVLIGSLLFSIVVIWYIRRARAGRHVYIRPIAGMEAIDEAIGRATEMGKPILYIAGLDPLGTISTITAMTILGRVARRTAEYETPLLVPCVDPLVMLAAREIVKEAYLDAGKPDAYREQDIFFLTDRQFAYVAGVDGIMLREKPAANVYMGYFYAEALVMAETGSITGAIQIAGTDSDTQIPFFVTSCDYTLMGEELYAATAYLSREPLLMAQLKAQDLGKAALGVLVAAAVVAASVAAFLTAGGLQHAADHINQVLDLFRPLG